MQPKVAVSPEIRAKALELTEDKSSEDEKRRAIYDFVSSPFRYIGVDLGLSRYTPHAASFAGHTFSKNKSCPFLFARNHDPAVLAFRFPCTRHFPTCTHRPVQVPKAWLFNGKL
jgi:hypothetical protein